MYAGRRWSEALIRRKSRGGGKSKHEGNGEYGRYVRAHSDTLLFYATVNGVGAKGAKGAELKGWAPCRELEG